MTNNLKTPRPTASSPGFEVGSIYLTRDGKEVRIVKFNQEFHDDYDEVVGEYLDENDKSECTWCRNGSFWGKVEDYKEHERDLMLP